MIEFTRRQALVGLGTFAAMPPALAETPWPTRPISLVHGFPPGGPVDVVSRILADGLSKRLGQRIVVDARPGAAGTTAAGQVAHAAPDGYTLMTVPATYPGTAAMYRTLPYRPIEDFSMISMTVEYPYVLVTHADHSIRNMSDLISAARSQSLQYGTAGLGSLQHLSMELLAKVAKLRLQHIPYRGGAPAVTDLLGKRLDLLLDPPTALIQHINDGKLRALAVTSATRYFGLPDVPTVAEAGYPGYAVSPYQGIAAPAGLPASLVDRLNRDITTVLTEPMIVAQLRKLGNTPRPASPEEFKARLTADIAQWSRVIADAKIERV
jgi:tripartite-type tricarboxylate transporter receptor subunit TctC